MNPLAKPGVFEDALEVCQIVALEGWEHWISNDMAAAGEVGHVGALLFDGSSQAADRIREALLSDGPDEGSLIVQYERARIGHPGGLFLQYEIGNVAFGPLVTAGTMVMRSWPFGFFGVLTMPIEEFRQDYTRFEGRRA